MIHDPPLIRLRRTVPRPTEAQLAALRGTPTGFVVDAMHGDAAFSRDIKPIVADQASFCGVAVTCQVGPADNLAIFAALPLLQPSDVIVAAAGEFYGTAVVGDLVLGMAKNGGAVGFVTDGCVRDVPGIRDVGLPCFAAGVTPNSPAKTGPGTVNLPVTLAGRHVRPGDVVIGDQDGAVVVPFEEIDRVIAALEEIRAAEAALVAKVQGGLKVPPWVEAMHRDGRVVEVD
ncbi:RraA family protein [Enterovirga rhinocerotis]|uniref:Putative 4-hydroxy-4-methyl-2-oxoglutarate aldolase n=1 Tax=Enterovirga rhinocerotis TaxID=1339210 RepID=A0A4R7BWP4_9HYPH|nr:RraA family protein [Enterovirga rhinocerotis]TDR89923.1 regulator of RNase E activity RraA [Enterovirga rhinocerotis]